VQTRPLRGFARSLLWPVRRFFDPRFRGLAEQIGVGQQDLAARLDAARAEGSAEALATRQEHEIALRRSEKAVLAALRELRRSVEHEIEASSELATIVGRSLSDLLGEADRLREMLEALQREVARPPITAYVFRALASVPSGGSVLVDSSETTVSVGLASLGYEVTALDGQPEGAFDAVVSHRADEGAMRRLRELTKPGGLLVLTALGSPRAEVETLLAGWEVEDITVAAEQDGVVLVTARRKD
jgi:hypothetical protein